MTVTKLKRGKNYFHLWGCYQLFWEPRERGWRIHYFDAFASMSTGEYVWPDGSATQGSACHYYHTLEAIEHAVALHKLRQAAEQ